MSNITLIIALIITIITPSLLYFGFKMTGKKLKTVLGINIFSFIAIVAAGSVMLFSSAFAEGEAVAASSAGLGYIAAALVTGLASIGAGIAVAAAAAAAIGAISEDSKVMGKALIFVALAEGIALYGLLVSFTIIGKL